MTLQAIARTGENTYVLVPTDATTESPVPQDTPARVLDTRDDELHRTVHLGSIVAHDPYLEPVELSVDETQELLADAGISDPTIGTPQASND